jgi:acyl carrier protein
LIREDDIRSALSRAIGTSSPDKWAIDYNFLESEVDSLDHATFLLALEEDFELHVPEENVADLDTIKSVLTFAENKQPR